MKAPIRVAPYSPLAPVSVALVAALRQTPILRPIADEVEAKRARD